MTDHEIEHKQAPGWWPNLIHARCSCGWSGPVRNANDYRWSQVLYRDLQQDGETHLRDVGVHS